MNDEVKISLKLICDVFLIDLLLVVFVYLLIKEWNVILLGELIFIGY